MKEENIDYYECLQCGYEQQTNGMCPNCTSWLSPVEKDEDEDKRQVERDIFNDGYEDYEIGHS